ncbi:MAG: amidohydrolase family protein [Actinomycetota bacterium]|nr:amidohydrolase family protein [Actinomycetota bacterium]
MTTTLFGGGRVRTATGTGAQWVLVEDSTISAVGTSEAPPADRTVDLDGATLTPAFCDAHVHLPATGLYAQGMDFRGEHSRARILDAFSDKARDPEAILFGGNFEDPLDQPLAARELDAAVGQRAALLARADMHSCIASTALLNELELDDIDGVDRDENGHPTGYLREHAAAEAWRWFDAHMSPEQQRAAVEAAALRAYSKGVGSVHEMFVVEWRGWSSLEVFLAAADDLALNVKTYVATPEVERALELGLDCVGGDFFLDGSFGTHTAWLQEAYVGEPPSGSSACGTSYRSDEELLEFFTLAQRAGLQAGVHAIGDAAIEQAIRTWEKVSEAFGVEQVKAVGHRIEHFECAKDEHIHRAARLGLRASVQPAFDAFWGGTEGLYAQRIGEERALEMNRFASMQKAGLIVGAGSDSTVTPLDPFLQMTALRAHHLPEESMSPSAALKTHTLGSHALARHQDKAGSLAAGMRADLALLDRDPLEVDPDELLKTEVLGTWIAGERVWPQSDAETA